MKKFNKWILWKNFINIFKKKFYAKNLRKKKIFFKKNYAFCLENVDKILPSFIEEIFGKRFYGRLLCKNLIEFYRRIFWKNFKEHFMEEF